MPGRGRGARGRGRKKTQRADDTQQSRPKRQRVSFDNEDSQERGMSTSILDCEEIIRASDVLPRARGDNVADHVAPTPSVSTAVNSNDIANVICSSCGTNSQDINNTEMLIQTKSVI